MIDPDDDSPLMPTAIDIEYDLRMEDGGARRIVAGSEAGARYLECVRVLNGIQRDHGSVQIRDIELTAEFYRVDDAALGKNRGWVFRLRELFGWSPELSNPMEVKP